MTGSRLIAPLVPRTEGERTRAHSDVPLPGPADTESLRTATARAKRPAAHSGNGVGCDGRCRSAKRSARSADSQQTCLQPSTIGLSPRSRRARRSPARLLDTQASPVVGSARAADSACCAHDAGPRRARELPTVAASPPKSARSVLPACPRVFQRSTTRCEPVHALRDTSRASAGSPTALDSSPAYPLARPLGRRSQLELQGPRPPSLASRSTIELSSHVVRRALPELALIEQVRQLPAHLPASTCAAR